ncbi:MAG: 23S rRNA (pseudouridine(1915)-N(3))-methyltransferase RlmH [Gammaproteobacteria bacterium]
MKIRLIAIGTRMPGWVQQGCREYSARLGREWGFELLQVPLARRSKSVPVARCVEQEGEALLAHADGQDLRVSLCVEGSLIDTAGLAARLDELRQEAINLSLFIGGPDGISERCREQCQETWSLGRVTLPHPLVRVIMVEQLYRASCILQGHPYHRE